MLGREIIFGSLSYFRSSDHPLTLHFIEERRRIKHPPPFFIFWLAAAFKTNIIVPFNLQQ
jgi:hypothetical protein